MQSESGIQNFVNPESKRIDKSLILQRNLNYSSNLQGYFGPVCYWYNTLKAPYDPQYKFCLVVYQIEIFF